jgi:DNA-binding NarL/FixJ family response regulator
MNANPPIPALKVFLVEDHASLRDRIAELVCSVAGTQVVGMADDPDGAYAGISLTQPDMVVVDLQLKSGTSGLAVLRWLREHAPGIAAIVLTNSMYPQMKEACLELGARLVLDKSSEALRVRDAVRELARG